MDKPVETWDSAMDMLVFLVLPYVPVRSLARCARLSSLRLDPFGLKE